MERTSKLSIGVLFVYHSDSKGHIALREYRPQPVSYKCSRNRTSLIRIVSLFRPSRSSSRLTKNNPRELRSGGCPRVISICPLQSGIISQESAFPRPSGCQWHSWPVRSSRIALLLSFSRWSELTHKNRSSITGFLFMERYVSMIYQTWLMYDIIRIVHSKA